MTDPDVVRLAARLRAAGSVWAEDEAALLTAAASGGRLEELVLRRLAGEPLETVLGWVDFGGLRLVVAPGVFVPRRRTELLARVARDRLPDGGVLVELCSGVAPVAAYAGAGAEVHVADVDERALACARTNVPQAAVHLGDLYDALPGGLLGRVDVLAANAPYVPTGEITTMPREARDHEQPAALDGGSDGVDVHRRIAAGACHWLRDGGVLAIETSPRQAPLTAAAMTDAGLVTEVVRDDDLDATVVVGVRPGERG